MFGLEILAASLVFRSLFRFLLVSYFMRKTFGTHDFIDLVDLSKIATSTILVMLCCLLVKSFAFQSVLLELAVGGLFSAGIFILAQIIFKQVLYSEYKKIMYQRNVK
jgi:uncharacterized membrane protein YhdT